MKKLTIVILSFNTKKLLIDCLKSIPTNTSWEIVIPDNGSTDGTLEEIPKLFPDVKFLQNEKNLGFAAGNNVALRKITTEYTLLLNPDTIVMPGAIETVLEFMEKNTTAGAATCRVELPDGSLDYSSHRGFPDPVNSLLHFLGFKNISKYSSVNYPNYPHEIDSLTGAFALVRTKVGNQVGWFDEDYFWNGEDIDLCYKIKNEGFKIFFLPQIKIIHFKGSSAKSSKDRRIKWAKNSTDVMHLFYRKHLEVKYPKIINVLVHLGINILYLFRRIKA